jgi:hypothetical protein
MTGSHNLGFKASSANDDNLAIVEGNAPLAAAYAINIIAIFQTYRWNSYVESHRADSNAWHGLVDNDQWQTGYLTGDQLAETQFWMKAQAAAPALAAAVGGVPTATAAPAQVHSVSSKDSPVAAIRRTAPVKKAAPAKKKVAPVKKAPAKKKK